MKKLLLSVMLLSATMSVIAQVTTEWVNQPRGVSIATDATNNVYTVDWDYNPGGDITLTKRNTSGNILWQVPYDNTDVTRHEVATWVETDNDGNIYVSGIIRSGYSSPVNAASLLMKYDGSGNLLWRQVFETAFDGSYTKKILVDAENNVYVLGTGAGPLGYTTKVKKFAPDGSIIWNYFDVAGIGLPVNFKFTPDNKIVISARSVFGSVSGFAKIDLDGNNIWSYTGINSITIGDAAGDNFGNTYFTSVSKLTKLSPAGSLIWERMHTLAGYRVEVGTDNAPVISGFPNSGTAGAAFMKYNPDGTVQWENLDADGPSYGLLLHAQMILDASNNAYLAAGTLFEMAVCKINSNGTAAWTHTAPGSYANGFDLGADNNVYVVGGNTAKFVQVVPPSCTTPTGLFTNNTSKTKARLNWTIVPGAQQYEVWGRKINTSVWIKSFVAGTKNFLNVPGLKCGTTYEWKIRTVCDSSSGNVSAFSSLQKFNTTSCTAITSAIAADDAQLNGDKSIVVYPNPVKANGSLQVKGLTGNFTYTVYTISGIALQRGSITNGSIRLDNKIKAGTYILELKSTKQAIRTTILVTE